MSSVHLDKLDSLIVSLLKKDGRRSNADMARAANVSEGTIRRRLKRLVKEEYIQVTVQPQYSKLGYQSQALVALQVSPDKIANVAQTMLASEEVIWVSATTGSFDLFAWVTLRNAHDLGSYLRGVIGNIEGVRRTETFVNLPMDWSTV
jgi:Lrp/AsnC family transcriptional regulator for asnA, asnC and gidA